MKAKIKILLLFVSILLIPSCNRINDPEFEDVFVVNPVEPSSLKIFSPTYQEVVQPGSTLNIKWNFPDDIEYVQISIYRKESKTELISIKTENTGLYEWKIPDDFKMSVHYRINIALYNTPVVNKFSEYFFILKPNSINMGKEEI